MRPTLNAYRHNPIALDDAHALVKHIEDHGGLMRIEFASKDGSVVTRLARPVRFVKTPAGDISLIVSHIATVDLKPVGAHPKEEKQILLKKIVSLGYNEPYDLNDAITTATGAYRFLHPAFLQEDFWVGKTKYPSLAAAVEAAQSQLSEMKTLDPEPAKAAVSLLLAKYLDPYLRRMLILSGNRPLAISPQNGGTLGSTWQFDLNRMHTRLREGLQKDDPNDEIIQLLKQLSAPREPKDKAAKDKARLASSRPLFQGARIPVSQIPEEQGSGADAVMFAEMHRAQMETDSERALIRGQLTASQEAPEITWTRIEDLEAGASRDFDALLYISDGPSDPMIGRLAAFEENLPYLVVTQSGAYDDMREAAKVAKWIARHQDWRFAVALPKEWIVDKKPELYVYALNLLSEVRSKKVYEAAQRSALSTLYSAAGHLVSPFSGTVVRVHRTASDVEIGIETEPPLPAVHHKFELSEGLKEGRAKAKLRELNEAVPPRTERGHYAWGGDGTELKLEEVLVVPLSRAPYGNIVGREVEPGDEIKLTGLPTEAGKKVSERFDIDGMLIIFQKVPVDCAEVVVKKLSLTGVTNRRELADKINAMDYLMAAAEEKRTQFFSLSTMDKDEKKEYLDRIEQQGGEPNCVRDGRAATYAIYDAYVAAGVDPAEAGKRAENEKPFPRVTPDPVFYVVFLDSKKKRAYFSGEVGPLSKQDVSARQQQEEDKFKEYLSDEQVAKKAQFSRYMSDLPLNAGGLETLRSLSSDISLAIFNYLIPMLDKGEKPSLFKWMSSSSSSPGGKEAKEELRTIVQTSRAATAVSRALPGRSETVARVKLGTQGASPTSQFVSSLREGPKAGRFSIGEDTAEVSVAGSRSATGASLVQVAGIASRFYRYMERLVKFAVAAGPGNVTARTDAMATGRVLRGYGLQAPAELRGTERAKWTRETPRSKDLIVRSEHSDEPETTYLSEDPATDLQRKYEKAVAFLSKAGEGENSFEYFQSLAVVRDYEQVQAAVKHKKEQEKAAGLAERGRQVRQAGLGPVARFALAMNRPPDAFEESVLARAVSEGVDIDKAIEALKAKSISSRAAAAEEAKQRASAQQKKLKNGRRNPSDPDDPFADEEDLLAKIAAVSEKATAETEQRAAEERAKKEAEQAAKKEKQETALVRAGDISDEVAGTLPARAPGVSTTRLSSLPSHAFTPVSQSRTVVIPEEEDVIRGRAEAATKYAAFVRSMRSNKAKPNELQALLDDYKASAARLLKLLDQRDTAVLELYGATTLKGRLLEEAKKDIEAARRVEATRDVNVVQAPYTRGGRGSGQKNTEKSRLAVAKVVGEMLDFMGRPLAPPSKEELQHHKLSPTALAPSGKSSLLGGSALTYTDLVQAAKLAAQGERKSSKGQAPSTVSCRVMRPDEWVSQRLNRKYIGRMMNSVTYQGQRNARSFRQFRSALIRISPDRSRAIFFLGSVALCEFHNSSFIPLLRDTLHFAQDWFNDPRALTRSSEYTLWIGQSGVKPQDANIYALWVQQEDDDSRMTAQQAASNLAKQVKLSDKGLGAPTEAKNLGSYRPLRWITDTTADTRFGADVGAILQDEVELFNAAVSNRPSSAATVLLQGPEGLRASMASTTSAAMARAMAGKDVNVMLFYPVLYGKTGALASENEKTGFEIAAQLKWLVTVLPRGAKVRIVDASLFATVTAQSMLAQPLLVATSGKVPTPFAFLRDQLARRKRDDVEIELVLPRLPGFDELQTRLATPEPGKPKLTLEEVQMGMSAIAALPKTLLPGSMLFLWNDPDMGDPTVEVVKEFGAADGTLKMATIIANNIAYIKQVIIEASTFTVPQGGGASVEVPYVLPENVREIVIDLLEEKVAGAGTDPLLRLTALGLPVDLFKAANLPSQDPSETAKNAYTLVAKAYKREYSNYIILGDRANMWGGDPILLANRGAQSRNRVRVLSRRR
jgi:hypothetical protein